MDRLRKITEGEEEENEAEQLEREQLVASILVEEEQQSVALSSHPHFRYGYGFASLCILLVVVGVVMIRDHNEDDDVPVVVVEVEVKSFGLTTRYHEDICLNGVICPESVDCPLGFSYCNERVGKCIWPETGHFDPPLVATAASSSPPPLILPRCQSTDIEGSWIDENWVPYYCDIPVSSYLIDPSQLFRILRNERVVFTGNSLVRQLFNRFIHQLHGWKSVHEQYYHNHAFYNVNGDGNTDRFGIMTGEEVPVWPSRDDDDTAGIQMIFAWMFSITFDRVLEELKPTLLILNTPAIDPNNRDDDVELHARHVDLIKQSFASHAHTSLKHVFVMDSSPRVTGYEWQPHIVLMSRIWKDFTEYMNAKDEQTHYHFVSMDRLAQTSPFTKMSPRFEDRPTHYQCMWQPQVPAPPTVLKHPDNLDCRDRVNQELVRIIMNVLDLHSS
jgi:hypothetical protein